MTFSLYPEERHWWSFSDYAAVMSVTRELNAQRVLEFGPGSSTLSLIEGGACVIDTCEDDPDWFVAHGGLVRAAPLIALHAYQWADPLRIPSLSDNRYDLALIDGPLQIERRGAVIRFCAERSRSLLVPLEDSEPNNLRQVVESLGRPVKYIASGPLAGTFALVGPAC